MTMREYITMLVKEMYKKRKDGYLKTWKVKEEREDEINRRR